MPGDCGDCMCSIFPVAKYLTAKAVLNMYCDSFSKSPETILCILKTSWDHSKKVLLNEPKVDPCKNLVAEAHADATIFLGSDGTLIWNKTHML